MRSGAAWLSVAVLFLLAILGALATYLLSSPAIPQRSSFELDLQELRKLAVVHPGALPRRVNVAIVAESSKPAAGVLGGMRFDKSILVWTSFQVVAPDRSIVIDAPPDETFHREGRPSDLFFTESYDAVQQAMLDADVILVTHEHPDHIGGIARSAYLTRVVDRLLLTTEQARNGSAMRPVAFPRGLVRSLSPLDYDQYHPLAPGVVLVRAPGHTPGSQIVYVRLDNGADLLLVGDVAWHRTHLEEPRGKPLVTSWLMGEDHDAVANQLRTLQELSESSNVHVVISHDREQLASHIAQGILDSGFERR